MMCEECGCTGCEADPHDLRDALTYLLSGDAGMALMMFARIFDEGEMEVVRQVIEKHAPCPR